MNRIAKRALVVILLAFFLVGGFSFFVAEYVSQAAKWVIFPGSPHVYTGSNIDCGVATDREGVLLLDMRKDRAYSEDLKLRQSTVHWIGDRYGFVEAPALSHYAAQIAGYSLINGVYTYGETAGVAKLTLSAQAQIAAMDALGDRKGTVAVYNYKTGELLCAVSAPNYDPDHVPDLEGDSSGKYEGMYLNRFTQSVYIPGSIFKIVTLAAALEEIPDLQQQKFTCTGSYAMGVDKITCESAHGTQDVKAAFRNSCNCAFAQISKLLGADALEKYVEQFGVTKAQSFDGITTAAGNFQVDKTPVNLAWSSIGQYLDQINPCAFMTFVGAIAGGGSGAQPYLVESVTVDKSVTYQAKPHNTQQIMRPQTAQILQEYLRNNVENKYGAGNFGSLTVCAKTGTGEVGGGRKPNAMLAGFATDEAYPFAFIVCVEDGGYGASVCIPIAAKVLDACKLAVDGNGR